LKATAEEKNKEAFGCFLNKVSIFPKRQRWCYCQQVWL
jgi:hypothetical protein